ncbi:MAG: thioredoxin family protein [Pseudomonadota bacterium]
MALVATLTGCEAARFDPKQDAGSAFTAALTRATDQGRFLMVVFGADWCTDCRTLYANLQTPEVRKHMEGQMDFLTVDVGDKDRNLEFAESLGVSIKNGIPVAVFFDPQGKPIGATNEGQLEPSRYLTSRQILGFIRAVTDEQKITRPQPNKPSEQSS